MIRAVFYRRGDTPAGFSVSGHAGYADKGSDIVCAAVTSAVQMTANALTEVLKLPCDVAVRQDEVSVTLQDAPNEQAQAFLSALRMHLTLLCDSYPNTIRINDLEV